MWPTEAESITCSGEASPSLQYVCVWVLPRHQRGASCGGASVHAEVSGVCHVAADSEADTLYLVRKLLAYVPQNNMEDPPYRPTRLAWSGVSRSRIRRFVRSLSSRRSNRKRR